MHAIVAGADDHGLADHLREQGVEVAAVETAATRPALEDAGVLDAELFVVTDVADATAIPVAKDLNPDLRAVVYADRSLPEFVSGQTDLAVDPDLLGPETVAEELATQGR